LDVRLGGHQNQSGGVGEEKNSLLPPACYIFQSFNFLKGARKIPD
jgi:hypothetical protein